MSDALDLARKQCPHCGHTNRIGAKICTNCGYAFPATRLAKPEGVPLKRCPECGHENRLSAKVCSQCGHKFRSMESKGEKWCPRCGTVCRLEAKVCSQCGHKFRTNFADSPAAARSTRSAPEVIAPIIEPPIVQNPETPITLPTQFEAPPRLPDPPRLGTSTPPPPAADQTNTAPPDAPLPGSADDMGGEPAPDLTDIDFDSMRRTSPDHIDAAGRVIISLFNKKDRS